MAEKEFARILPLLGVAHLDRLFDYRIPEDLRSQVCVGQRVKIPFSGRTIEGFILELHSQSTYTGTIASIKSIQGKYPLLTPSLWFLVTSLAQRYAGNKSDILTLAIPPYHGGAEKKGLYENGVPWEELGSRFRDREAIQQESYHAAIEGWKEYRFFPSYLDAVIRGDEARASWITLPGEQETQRIAELAAATAWSGAEVLIITPDHKNLQRIEQSLQDYLNPQQITILSSAQGAEARFRRYLSVSQGQGRVVLGTRSAIFAPLQNCRLIILHQEADELYVEPRSPYLHAREVLSLRSIQEKTALLCTGVDRSLELQVWVNQGWVHPLEASAQSIRSSLAGIHGIAETEGAQDRDPLAEIKRIPRIAFEAIRKSLEQNAPAVVVVPRTGYAPALACARCRTRVRCRYCHGPMQQPGQDPHFLQCRWCGRLDTHFHCTECGYDRVRMNVIGQDRTYEELAQAFPGVPILSSGGKNIHTFIDNSARIVVATPKAIPYLSEGYGAAIILDAWIYMGQQDLRVEENTLRQWREIIAQVRPRSHGGEAIIAAPHDHPLVQNLLRWNIHQSAQEELHHRFQAQFPPTSQIAAIDGTVSAIDELLELWEKPDEVDLLGPVDLPPGILPPAGADPTQDMSRLLVRRTLHPEDLIPRTEGRIYELGISLHKALAQRSIKNPKQPLRIVVDPVRIG